jgi:hypothetical protein
MPIGFPAASSELWRRTLDDPKQMGHPPRELARGGKDVSCEVNHAKDRRDPEPRILQQLAILKGILWSHWQRSPKWAHGLMRISGSRVE